jgi:hypothetical protein
VQYSTPLEPLDYQKIFAKTSSLRAIHLGITGRVSRGPYADLILSATIGTFLGSMQFLRRLELTWNLGPERCLHLAVESSFDKSFYENTWPCLEDLALFNPIGSVASLMSLVCRHRHTLKTLRLDGLPKILGGHFYKDMLTFFRDNLVLERFWLPADSWDMPEDSIRKHIQSLELWLRP